MRHRLLLTLTLTLVTICSPLNSRNIAAAPAVERSDAAQESVALGVYLAMLPWDPTALDHYSAQVGAAPKTVMLYVDWARAGTIGGSDFPTASLDVIAAHGAMPLVTWEPWDPGAGAAQPAFADAAIAAGAHDGYIRAWAGAAKGYGRPLQLRLAHEMNTTSYPWGTGPGNANGNTPDEYVAMWRHVHDLFAAGGVTNVSWVWSPNTESEDGPAYAQLYPGDEYVDWVGIDGYNGGTALPWGGWLSLAQIFDRSYAAITALTTKPLMLAELGSAEAGGDKAAWITQGFLSDLPARYPRVAAVVWYNWEKETNWRIDSSAAALAAWQAVAAAPRYR
jgi:beta-mannanase